MWIIVSLLSPAGYCSIADIFVCIFLQNKTKVSSLKISRYCVNKCSQFARVIIAVIINLSVYTNKICDSSVDTMTNLKVIENVQRVSAVILRLRWISSGEIRMHLSIGKRTCKTNTLVLQRSCSILHKNY